MAAPWLWFTAPLNPYNVKDNTAAVIPSRGDGEAPPNRSERHLIQQGEQPSFAALGCAQDATAIPVVHRLQQPFGVSPLRRIVFAIWFGLATAAATASNVSVLFVGNSLTQANDLPTMLKRFAAESPLHAQIEVRSITPGGAFLRDHWQKYPSRALLREQRPNFLILQGQSMEPLLAPQSFVHYAGLFKAEADGLKTTTVLLSTWARPANDSYYQDPTSGGSPAEMQKRLNSAYASLARELGALFAPVGPAFERARLVAAGVELLDGTQHPSRAGTYLAAATLYRVIFHTSASSSYFADLPPQTAIALQRVANEVPLN